MNKVFIKFTYIAVSGEQSSCKKLAFFYYMANIFIMGRKDKIEKAEVYFLSSSRLL